MKLKTSMLPFRNFGKMDIFLFLRRKHLSFRGAKVMFLYHSEMCLIELVEL